MSGFVNALWNLVQLPVLAFAVVAGVSLWHRKPPPVPPFARRRAGNASRQLRADSNAGFFHNRGFLFRRRWFFVGTGCPPVRVDRCWLERSRPEQHRAPVRVTAAGTRTWWWFEGDFYWESGNYSAQDVLALIRDKQRKDEARLDRARQLLDAQRRPRRRPGIPREVRRTVFERDGGRCVECDADFDIQYDHIIPLSRGGGSTAANLQLLCGPCNRAKGANL